MAEPLKHRIDAPLVRLCARHLVRVHPAFPASAFVRRATLGLDGLELKARVQQVAAALAATLPADFGAAVDVLERSLAPARDDTDLGALVPGPAGLAGWIVWPMTEFVAQRGQSDPERALAALRAMTQRFTAEYAIRPFLAAHEERTLRTLHGWLGDPSAHVRRLVSEGSRPRLPWGIRLARFVADPSPTLPLLAALQDDPSDYVRRSVANHLNDIAKDHPDLVADWLERHLPGASPARRALLQRASRTLVKQGNPRVLAAWGLGASLHGRARLCIEPPRVPRGGKMQVIVEVRSASRRPQRLQVDYAVHHLRSGGRTSRRVWKGFTLELAAGERRTLQKSHSWRPTTIRTDQPGRHQVELLVNGRVAAAAAFVLM